MAPSFSLKTLPLLVKRRSLPKVYCVAVRCGNQDQKCCERSTVPDLDAVYRREIYRDSAGPNVNRALAGVQQDSKKEKGSDEERRERGIIKIDITNNPPFPSIYFLFQPAHSVQWDNTLPRHICHDH